MIYLVAFAVALGGIVFLLLWQRVNAAVVFFSLCAGSVLASQVGSDATVLGSSVIHSSLVTSSGVQIALIALPAVLSALFLRKSVKSSSALINILPALCVAALAAILIVPLLSAGLQYNLQSTIIWQNLAKNSQLIIVAGVVVSVISLWFSSRGKHHKRGHH